jgi:hypothetical protein
MGSPESETGRYADEGPQHQVTLTHGYFLARTELTQGQWQSVMGTSPWVGRSLVQVSPTNPAVYVSWDDVQGLVQTLNQAAGDSLYRLPSEAEWEHACRAGTTTTWSFGDDGGQLGQYAWYDANAWSAGLTWAQPVGTKLANPWGLYDMHGNVWEWVQDWYGGYSSEAQTDPLGPQMGSNRVSRGGYFIDYSENTRSARRNCDTPGRRGQGIGARLLLIARPTASTNHAPVLASVGSRGVAEGDSLTVTLSATDADDDALTFQMTGGPTGATLDGGVFGWRPTAGQSGLHRVLFTVSDGHGGAASDSLMITVAPVRPTAQWVMVYGTVHTEDHALAPVGTVVDVVDANGNVAGWFQLQGTGDYGYLSVYLDDPETIADEGADVGELLTMRVNGIPTRSAVRWTESGDVSRIDLVARPVSANRVPVLTPVGNRTVAEGDSLTVVLAASDADADSLSYAMVNGPAGSQLAGSTFGWRPDYAQAGTYSVTFDVSDGYGGTATEVVWLTVTNTNCAPVWVSVGNRTVAEGDSLTVALAASDVDADSLSYTMTNGPAGSQLVGKTFGWRPSYTQAGTYSVTFGVNDGYGGTASEVMSVTVSNTNRAPVLASIGSRTTAEWDSFTVVLSATDADAESVSYAMGNAPSGASLHGGVFSWVPAYGQTGTYEIMFTASDGQGGSDSKPMAVSVSSTLRQVRIDLAAGFNLVSWNVDTRDDSVQAVVAPVLTDVIAVQGFETGAASLSGGASGAKLFTPNGGAFNTLKVTSHRLGYWIKMRSPRTLAVTGRPVGGATAIPLAVGYNLVSYLPESVDSTRHAVASTSGSLVQVQGFETSRTLRNLPIVGAKLYTPAGGNFNTLRIMSPLMGYWIKVAETVTLTYPTGPAPGTPPARPVAGDAPVVPTDLWIAIYGHVVMPDGQPAPVGTIVDVVDGAGTLAGWFSVDSPGMYGYLPVYLDDPSTEADEGASVGEWLTLRVNGVPTGSRVQWTEFGNLTRLDLLASGPGAIAEGGKPTTSVLHGAFPNPFNPSTAIRYELAQTGDVRLTVYSTAGQLVRRLVAGIQQAGPHQVTWDGRDGAGALVGTGVFLGVLQTGEFRAVTRMVLMK